MTRYSCLQFLLLILIIKGVEDGSMIVRSVDSYGTSTSEDYGSVRNKSETELSHGSHGSPGRSVVRELFPDQHSHSKSSRTLKKKKYYPINKNKLNNFV